MRKLILPALLVATLPLAAQSSAAAPAPAASAPKPPAIPAAGAMAPDFSLPDETGKTRALSTLKGQPLLIAFYPKDFTGGWTKELSQLRDRFQELQAKGVTVLGVSTDTVASHKDFAEKLKLPFDLLADEHQAMTRAYGVLKSLDTGGEHFDYAQRSFFLIGPDGRLLYADPDFKLTEPGWTALFAAVEKLPRPGGKPKTK